MPRLTAIPLIALILVACTPNAPAAPQALDSTTPGTLAPQATPDTHNLPLLAAYQAKVRQALADTPPVLQLLTLNSEQEQAQQIALRDPALQPALYDPNTHQALRMEVFGVVPLRESDLTSATQACKTSICYRVEIYSWARNETLMATVDLGHQRVVTGRSLANTQPDVPPHLTQIANEIAVQSPLVQAEMTKIGAAPPQASAALMSNVKTALNTTRCERSQHLCVAPTFVVQDSALWAVVDLTDGMLVGTRWTKVGVAQPAAEAAPAATEKGLENDAVLAYCDKATHIEQDGWAFDYILTSSDGLRISDVRYRGAPLIESAKLVDWHVSYSRRDGFGYSDAVGCPYFSQSAVVAVRPPEIRPIELNGAHIGFSLNQEFWSELWPAPCNYYYAQAYSFYTDGRFRPAAASVGRGCGDDGTYRPVTRIAFAGAALTLAGWDAATNTWRPWLQEAWQAAADRAVGPGDAEYRLTDSAGHGFQIATGRGQFGDGGRGDEAYVYLTRGHTDRDEGSSDMPTIGPCCNTDERQGPEQFINGESTQSAPLVLWYVPQLKNSGQPGKEYCWANSALVEGVYQAQEFPCWSGPLLTPLPQGGTS